MHVQDESIDVYKVDLACYFFRVIKYLCFIASASKFYFLNSIQFLCTHVFSYLRNDIIIQKYLYNFTKKKLYKTPS